MIKGAELKSCEEEVKGNNNRVLLSSELVVQLQGGVRKDLDLIFRSIEKVTDVLHRDPTNAFTKEQDEKFELKFDRQLEELKNPICTSTTKNHRKKQPILALDLTADGDTNSSNSPDDSNTPSMGAKTVSPKAAMEIFTCPKMLSILKEEPADPILCLCKVATWQHEPLNEDLRFVKPSAAVFATVWQKQTSGLSGCSSCRE